MIKQGSNTQPCSPNSNLDYLSHGCQGRGLFCTMHKINPKFGPFSCWSFESWLTHNSKTVNFKEAIIHAIFGLILLATHTYFRSEVLGQFWLKCGKKSGSCWLESLMNIVFNIHFFVKMMLTWFGSFRFKLDLYFYPK